MFIAGWKKGVCKHEYGLHFMTHVSFTHKMFSLLHSQAPSHTFHLGIWGKHLLFTLNNKLDLSTSIYKMSIIVSSIWNIFNFQIWKKKIKIISHWLRTNFLVPKGNTFLSPYSRDKGVMFSLVLCGRMLRIPPMAPWQIKPMAMTSVNWPPHLWWVRLTHKHKQV